MTGKKRSEKRKRTIPLAGRFTPEEAALVTARAKEYGTSVSGYIRQRTIDAPPPRRAADRSAIAKLLTEFQRHRAELGKQGSNLNQIAYRYNVSEGRPTGGIEGALLAALDDFKRSVDTLDELRLVALQAMGSEPNRKPPAEG